MPSSWAFTDQLTRFSVVCNHLFHWICEIFHREWNTAFWLIPSRQYRDGKGTYEVTLLSILGLPPQVIVHKKIPTYGIVRAMYLSNNRTGYFYNTKEIWSFFFLHFFSLKNIRPLKTSGHYFLGADDVNIH